MKKLAYCLCMVIIILGCHNKEKTTPPPKPPKPSPQPAAVEIYDQAFTLNDFANFLPLNSLEILNDMLTEQVYAHEIELRKITPDRIYVQQRIENGIISLTDEEFATMKKVEDLVHELYASYLESEKDVEAFVAEVWQEREEELRELNIATDSNSLRSYLFLLEYLPGNEMNDALLKGLPDDKDEFVRQVNENVRNNIPAYRQESQLEQLQKALLGELTLTPEELEQGEKYFADNRDALLTSEVEALVRINNFRGILLQFKREYLLDCWVTDKIKQEVIFHDTFVEEAFLKWREDNFPRHRELFGSAEVDDK